MEEDNSMEFRLAQIPYLIDRMRQADDMIALHETGGSPAMIKQYQRFRNTHFQELIEILAEFGFEIRLKNSKSTSLKPTRKTAEKRLAAVV